MKIAILADPLDNQTAGVHTYTKQLIMALRKENTKHELLIIREKKDPDLPLPQIAIPNIRLPIGFASLRLFIIIPLILRFHKVDAVFEPAHFGPFNLPKRVKRVTMMHDITPLLFPHHHRLISQLLQRIFLKSILRNATIILANSKNTHNDIIKRFPFTTEKTKTILLGKDEEFEPVSSKTYLDKTGINSPYFLYTGTIEPRKNLNTLLDAFERFRKENDKVVKLLFVGKKGWKTKEFFDALQKHPYRSDIIITGYVDKKHLIEIYSHALALIYPSLYEGFGLPILEALSCGTPVICSDSSSLPEVGGAVALYFDPLDTSALTRHMNDVYQRPPQNTASKAALIAQSNLFSWKKYARRFLQVITGEVDAYAETPQIHYEKE